MLKITYEYADLPWMCLHDSALTDPLNYLSLNPKHFPLIDDVEETIRVAERLVRFEATLVKLVHGIGHGPESSVSSKGKQNEWMSCPGGWIYYMVTTAQ